MGVFSAAFSNSRDYGQDGEDEQGEDDYHEEEKALTYSCDWSDLELINHPTLRPEVHPIQFELTPHVFQLTTLPPTRTRMVDVREPEVDDLQKTGPLLSQHILWCNVLMPDSEEVDAIQLTKQYKPAI
jgi:hypothetical protein